MKSGLSNVRFGYAKMTVEFGDVTKESTVVVDSGCSDSLVDRSWVKGHSTDAKYFKAEPIVFQRHDMISYHLVAGHKVASLVSQCELTTCFFLSFSYSLPLKSRWLYWLKALSDVCDRKTSHNESIDMCAATPASALTSGSILSIIRVGLVRQSLILGRNMNGCSAGIQSWKGRTCSFHFISFHFAGYLHSYIVGSIYYWVIIE